MCSGDFCFGGDRVWVREFEKFLSTSVYVKQEVVVVKMNQQNYIALEVPDVWRFHLLKMDCKGWGKSWRWRGRKNGWKEGCEWDYFSSLFRCGIWKCERGTFPNMI